MRNYKGAFYRTDEISREPNQCPDWIDQLAAKMDVDESIKVATAAKTAVEVARQRPSGPSIYEMMSAIVSGQKPKYSSVEEAVKDYQRRTGLEEYLKRSSSTSDLSALASEIIATSHDDEEDEETGKDEDSDVAYRRKTTDKDRVDEDKKCYQCGKIGSKCTCDEEDYDDARDMTEEELADNPGKKKLISEGEKPNLLQEYPGIERFITNVIETNHGIQVPALLHSIIETFGREGINGSIYSDRDLLSWINQKMIEKGNSRDVIPSHLGRGVGTQIDYTGDKDSNRDPFTLLVPDKG